MTLSPDLLSTTHGGVLVVKTFGLILVTGALTVHTVDEASLGWTPMG